MNRRYFTINLLALLLAPGLVLADRYADQAQAQLDKAAQVLRQYNYVKTHEPIIDLYYPRRGVETVTARLRADTKYAIIGTCDEDCTDIDLGLFDASGKLVIMDEKRDDLPILEFRPRQTGIYYIKVALPRCRAQSCMYGIGFYGQIQTPPAPTSSSSVEVVETPILVTLLQKYRDAFLLIDARDGQDYRKGHIPTAISVPYNQVYALSHYLPEDHSTLLIFYCWHTECEMSKTAAEAARKMGYQRVAVYTAGVRGWEQAGYRLVNDFSI